MRNLEGIIDKIDSHISEKDQAREHALKISREIIIKCRKAIQKLHNDNWDEAEKLIEQSSGDIENLNQVTKKFPDLLHAGFVENAAQEYVEAQCFYNILHEDELPDPDSLQTTYNAYLLGLGDVVGELRRGALDLVMKGDTDRAYEYLGYMDNIYDALMQFDYPSNLVPIKRKQDTARSLIEKTRGELAVASCERRIDDRANEFRGILDQLNGSTEKKSSKKGKNVDLDVDQVW
jgi:translin